MASQIIGIFNFRVMLTLHNVWTVATLANYKITLALRSSPPDLRELPLGGTKRHLHQSATETDDGLSVLFCEPLRLAYYHTIYDIRSDET